MKAEEFEQLVYNVVERIRLIAPEAKGNLKKNAIRYEHVDNKTYKIYVDEKIAPYMKYTNENWGNFRPPLQGKKNPNEGWWTNGVYMEIIKTIQQQLGNRLVDEEG